MSSSATGRSGPQIGYCHTCDRQVEIDPVSFECNRCHGGFIEIFDIEQQQQQQQQQPQQSPGGAQARVIRLNNQNFGDVLPLFLQMLAQGGGGGAGGGGGGGGQMPPMFSAGLGGAGARMPGDAAETASASDSLSSDSGGAAFNMRPGTTTTRLQVLVPSRLNEAGQDQFDLYGVINNVINDLLDPRRTGQATGQNSFHFQAPPIRIINLHSDARDYAWGAGGLDAIITQLLNQLENTGPPPASQDQLHNLPVITISQEQVDTNVQCAICMEDFALNEKAKKLPCKHLFHEPCITEWLKLHGTCPVCRKNLNGEDTSQREYISRPPPGNNNNNNGDDSNNSSGATSSGSGGGGAGGGVGGEGSSNAAASSQQPAQDSTSSNPHPNPSRSRDNNFYDADFD